MAKQLALLTAPPLRRVRLTTWDLLQNRLPLEEILRQRGINPDLPYRQEQDPNTNVLIVTQSIQGSRP